MEDDTPHRASILILYYSLSSQTKNVLQALATGLEAQQCSINWERIETVGEVRFPAGGYVKAFLMMVETFFRKKYAIKALSEKAYAPYDFVIVSGPTWSYHPSGPVLAFFKQYGSQILSGKNVLGVISCRSYWRFHRVTLRHLVKQCGGSLVNTLVFTHPGREPWRTIGVFLKLVGKVPESRRWFSRYYPKYGHSRKQMTEIQYLGEKLGKRINEGKGMTGIV